MRLFHFAVVLNVHVLNSTPLWFETKLSMWRYIIRFYRFISSFFLAKSLMSKWLFPDVQKRPTWPDNISSDNDDSFLSILMNGWIFFKWRIIIIYLLNLWSQSYKLQMYSSFGSSCSTLLMAKTHTAVLDWHLVFVCGITGAGRPGPLIFPRELLWDLLFSACCL